VHILRDYSFLEEVRLQLSGGGETSPRARAQAAAGMAVLPHQGGATPGRQSLLPPQGHGQDRAEPVAKQSQVLCLVDSVLTCHRCDALLLETFSRLALQLLNDMACGSFLIII